MEHQWNMISRHALLFAGAEKRLRDVQRRRIEDYIRSMKNSEDDNNDMVFDDMYVDLQSYSELYLNRLLTPPLYWHKGNRPIDVPDLFLPDKEGDCPPRRILVIGKRGIGKTMLSFQILHKWLNGQLPSRIKHVFYFALQDLVHFSKPSTTDLFVEHHEDDASGEFHMLMSDNPANCLLIFDGLSECDPEYQVVPAIIKGKTLPSVCVLVTSAPGGMANYMFDKSVEIYGLTQDKISEYISKFCKGDHDLKECIENYINAHAEVAAMCYIPMHCCQVCRLVMAEKKYHRVGESPKTITQLYIQSLKHVAVDHHPHKNDNVADAEVFGQLKEFLLSHVKLAKAGMGKSPMQDRFSQREIDDLHMMKAARECGLLTLSKLKKRKSLFGMNSCSYSYTHSSSYSYSDCMMQEFLDAVALVSSPQQEEVKSLVMDLAYAQDIVLVFMCGLVGDNNCKEFLDALGCQPQMTVERVFHLAIERQNKKGRMPHNRGCDYTRNDMLLQMIMMHESQRPVTVANHYDRLNLSRHHISPVELQAMASPFQIFAFILILR